MKKDTVQNAMKALAVGLGIGAIVLLWNSADSIAVHLAAADGPQQAAGIFLLCGGLLAAAYFGFGKVFYTLSMANSFAHDFESGDNGTPVCKNAEYIPPVYQSQGTGGHSVQEEPIYMDTPAYSPDAPANSSHNAPERCPLCRNNCPKGEYQCARGERFFSEGSKY